METVKETELPFIRETVENMLSVDVDLGTYYLQLQKYQEIAFLAERLYGLRIIREADPYECLIKTIIGQQMNLSFAATLVRRLVETVSTPLLFEGTAYYPFPSPEEIASLSYEQLTQLQFSRRKAEYVIDLSRKTAEGGLKFDDLDRKGNEEIMERLLPERGVGRWTVECFLLFGLGRTDLLPAADIGLRNAVKKWYGLKEQPTEADIRRMGADWTPWSSYFTFYLWESLNQPDLMPAIPDPTEP
ncbi:DNA-3-methyladenine glycosylase [Paenibacillus sp. CC-CFT747]|nr:DNA-3-methyladenine glycosylase [Paenibacillus sp. CC-CFT747]